MANLDALSASWPYQLDLATLMGTEKSADTKVNNGATLNLRLRDMDEVRIIDKRLLAELVSWGRRMVLSSSEECCCGHSPETRHNMVPDLVDGMQGTGTTSSFKNWAKPELDADVSPTRLNLRSKVSWSRPKVLFVRTRVVGIHTRVES